MTRSFPVLALLAVGCTPHSAELTDGMMWGFLSETTSFSLISGAFETADAESSWNIDCREFEDDEDVATLADPLDICDGNTEVRPGVELAWPPTREIWLNDGAFQGFSEPIDPWRGEGFMTFEGDFQVGFHTRLPGGEDFRFQFVVNPVFEPTRCVQDGDQVTAEAVDGDWIEEWSKDIDLIAQIENAPAFVTEAATDFSGGELFYLNARSFQYNPSSTDDTWSLPEEWEAGFAQGSFIDEDIIARPTRYAEPAAYGVDGGEFSAPPPQQVWYADCPAEQAAEDCNAHQTEVGRARRAARDTMDEFLQISPPGTEPFYRPLNQSNLWRPIDGRPTGLDGWTELNYSWVMLSEDSNLEVGGSATGAFQILFDGLDSQSRIIIQGRFEVPKIKKDSWGGKNLRAEKLEESGVELCIR